MSRLFSFGEINEGHLAELEHKPSDQGIPFMKPQFWGTHPCSGRILSMDKLGFGLGFSMHQDLGLRERIWDQAAALAECCLVLGPRPRHGEDGETSHAFQCLPPLPKEDYMII